MNNFVRSLKLALRYRYTLAGAVASALAVAVLWGGNIGAVYPLVEISFKGESLPDWTAREIDEQRRTLVDLDAKLAALPADAEARGNASLEVAAKRRTLELYEWAQQKIVLPYLDVGPFQTLVLVVGLLLLGTLVKSAFLVVNQILVFRAAHLVVFDLRKQLYRKTLRSDLSRFTNEGGGEVMSRFTYDMESLLAAQQEFFGKLIREPLKMLACFIGAALINWRLLLFSLILAPPAAYLIRVLAKALKQATRRVMEEMSEMYGILDETIHGIKVVKAFTMERTERRRFHQCNKACYKKAMRIGRYDSLTRPLTEIIGICTISVALLGGAYLVLNNATHLFGIRLAGEAPTLGMMLVFFGMLAGTSDPARKLTDVFSRVPASLR